ncbi:phasin family protein [Variovorax sp. CCNWLW225]|jgi:poly(hydroxyalkanoate) granule-associated protein|uniref:Poly(Hydroxyalkanoate) granule-associated protein n=1 Tax=Variovorax paradoxus TaxID=34073 RepID=A0A6I6HFY7_VARPD|nr:MULTISPECIES: phasin family protein [Variovorax]MCR8958143.1 phasin family protein [Variovorax sp. S12S4]QGW80425.1 poly(hydroxyalkanoate) granule-associated protein [Variovorax paradoxus]
MATQDDENGNNKGADRIKDSAQQIWLAGLGAFAKMQQEGSKAFEALVKDGAGMQKKTQAAAEETLAQAQTRMAGFASEFGTKAAGQWGKLENIFEERVARALEKLGLPSAADYAALQARVAALEAELQRSEKKPAAAPARASRKTAGRSAAPAAAPKKTVRRSTKAG